MYITESLHSMPMATHLTALRRRAEEAVGYENGLRAWEASL